MNAIRDDFNPKFVFFSSVSPGEVASGRLSAEGFAPHIDDAIRAFCAEFDESRSRFDFDKEMSLELLNPLSAGTMRIDLWVESLDDATCNYGFLCSSASGAVAYARGERTLTKLDARSHRPLPWSEDFRRTNAGLLRDLHAFA